MKVHSRSDFIALELSFSDYNESYLRGSFGCNAKRTKKTHGSFREPQPDTLWWHLFAAPLLDSNWVQESGRNGGSVGPAEQSLQRRRTVAGDHLSDDPRAGTDRDHAPGASQWCLSVLERPDALPECHDPETVSLADGTAGGASVAQAPRSLLGQDEHQAAPAAAFDFRFGFQGADRLRKTRSGRCWLPTLQAGKQIVPSAALFRRTNEGLLAWGAASRSCLYGGRSSRSPRGLLCPNPRPSKTGYHPCRQGFLRSQDHCLAGAKKGSLCDRCQADSVRQATALRLALPPSWGKRFHRPVLLPAIRIAQTLPLCSGATTPNRRDQRATDSLQVGPVFLSSVYYQSRAATIEPVALLQRPGGRGTDHSRTQRQLSLGQDSDASFPGQRDLLSSLAAAVQFCQLVP